MATLRADALDLIVFDFDGVLTDNRVVVFEDGREAVVCNRADGLAFDFLRRVGMPVYLLSTETNPVVEARAAKLKVKALVGLTDKAEAVAAICRDEGYAVDRLMFVGNDVNDLAAMRAVGYPVAVADAHQAVRCAAWRVLDTPGGAGTVREIVERIILFDEPFFQLNG